MLTGPKTEPICMRIHTSHK